MGDSRPAKLGDLIWESPVVPSVPAPVLYLVGGIFTLLGLSFSIVAVPMLTNARDRSGGIAASVLIVILVGTGIWLILRARNARRLLGVQFFQDGIGFGPSDPGLYPSRLARTQADVTRVDFSKRSIQHAQSAALGGRPADSVRALRLSGVPE